MSHALLLVTVWSVCHVSRGQALTESVTGGSDYLESSDDGVSDFYDTSYDIPLLAPDVVGGERGDAIPGVVGESIREPTDILLSENNRDSSETDPYNVPILGDPYDNVILTELEDQQETLPLVRDQVEEGDMCRLAGTGAESILLELPESRGEDYSQLTTPRQLPIMGQVSQAHSDHD